MHSFDVIIERDEDGVFVASVPELPGCRTQAPTRAEIIPRIKEAIALYMEVKGAPSTRPRFIGVERVEVEA
ncbi:MAG: type II toxin-antitoxin system HicB family antitoxin [Thermoplasmatota archaeon]